MTALSKSSDGALIGFEEAKGSTTINGITSS